MSYVKSNLSAPNRSHGFTAEEASQMSVEDFDKLCLEDQIFVYNHFQNDYCRLSGRPYEGREAISNADNSKHDDDNERAIAFAEEFERRVDRAFANVTGHKCGEIPENP